MSTSSIQIPRHGALLLLPWFVLLVFGTIMVGSSSVAMAGDYVTRQLVNLCVSIFLLVIVAVTPLSFWRKYYGLGWLASLVLVVLVFIPGLGHEVNGATRWIRLPGFNLQAVEVAKFGLMIYLAGYLARYHDDLERSPIRIFIPLAMVFAICALVVAEPDLGSAAVVLLSLIHI